MTEQLKDINHPHDNDVLSGRGNFVNYHPGNEQFRSLVRKHKVAYVACPKPQKGKFSKIIYDEIRSMNPPGRFLKQDPKTKLWFDIGEKKALDKTRQALREGAPDIMKELNDDEDEDETSLASPMKSAQSINLPIDRSPPQSSPTPAALGLTPNSGMNSMSSYSPMAREQSPLGQASPFLRESPVFTQSYASIPTMQQQQRGQVARTFSAPLTVGSSDLAAQMSSPYQNISRNVSDRLDQLRLHAMTINQSPHQHQHQQQPMVGAPLQAYAPPRVSQRSTLTNTDYTDQRSHSDKSSMQYQTGPRPSSAPTQAAPSHPQSGSQPVASMAPPMQSNQAMTMQDRMRARAALMQQRVHPGAKPQQQAMGSTVERRPESHFPSQGTPSAFLYRPMESEDEIELPDDRKEVAMTNFSEGLRRHSLERQTSERSIGMEGVFKDGLGASNHSVGLNSVMTDGDMSNMSLSVSGINPQPFASDGPSSSTDQSDLSNMFSNSMKIGASKRGSSHSKYTGDMNNVMNMSILSADENFSEFGESGYTKMEESVASFSNVFD